MSNTSSIILLSRELHWLVCCSIWVIISIFFGIMLVMQVDARFSCTGQVEKEAAFFEKNAASPENTMLNATRKN